MQPPQCAPLQITLTICAHTFVPIMSFTVLVRVVLSYFCDICAFPFCDKTFANMPVDGAMKYVTT